jgi:hypothetical protein
MGIAQAYAMAVCGRIQNLLLLGRLTMRFAAVALLALSATLARADEGMWMPTQLPELKDAFARLGSSKSIDALADLERGPLAAIVRAGGGTGSFVSSDGLILTNHHVAFGVIQFNSTPEKNLTETGYIAAARAEELRANPEFRVLVTTAFDDVSERVLKPARGKRDRAYFDAIDQAIKREVADCERAPNTRCSVATMDYGARFFRITQLELRDVRLVYAPPRAIGNFGDEIDNFMWPRHTGDFAFLRAYVNRSGAPADYAPANVPFKPASYLKFSTAGVSDGDFAMVAGYPGVTHRHRLSREFAERVEWSAPLTAAVFNELIAIIEARGASDPQAKVRYAAQLAALKNNLKRADGERTGLIRSDAVAKRRAIEQAIKDEIKAPDQRAQRAGIRELHQVLNAQTAVRERDILLGWVVGQSQLLRAALNLNRLALERQKPEHAREVLFQTRDEPILRAQLEQLDRRFDSQTEQALLTALLTRYQALPDGDRLAGFDAAFGRDAISLDRVLKAAFRDTELTDKAKRLALFAATPNAVMRSDDALLKLTQPLLEDLLTIENQRKARDGEQLRLRPQWIAALRAHYRATNQPFYPDANQTLRLSIGRLEALHPRDAVHYAPQTSVIGILEKAGAKPFDAPAPLLGAIQAKNFGPTADATLGTQPVNFLTNLDTTGGNSGSPILDAQGRLSGINFDSNWESVSASWFFDPRYKRAIHVDVRYIEWLVTRVYPSPSLINELGLRR